MKPLTHIPLLLCAAIYLISAVSFAGTVEIIGTANHPLVIQLEDELCAIGETVLVTHKDENTAGEPQKKHGPLKTPDTFITVNIHNGELTIRVVSGPQAAHRRLSFSTDSTDDVLVIAVEVMEEIQVLRQQLAPKTSYIGKEFAEEKPPAKKQSTGVFGLGLGPSMLWSRGGFGGKLYVTPVLWTKIHPRIEIEIQLDIPTTDFNAQEPEGTATLRLYQGTLGLAFNPMHPKKPFRLPIGPVVGIGWSSFHGEATPPHRSDQGHLLSAILGGRMALMIAVSSNLRLRMDGMAGIYIPEQQLFLGNQRVVRFGRPFIRGLVSLEIVLP